MISWYRFGIWYICFGLPWLILWLPGLMPTLTMQSQVIGGGPLREWVLNHTFFIVLSADAQTRLSSLWHSASWLDEVLWYTLAMLNVFALAVPVLYGVGDGIRRLLNRRRITLYLIERHLFKTSRS